MALPERGAYQEPDGGVHRKQYMLGKWDTHELLYRPIYRNMHLGAKGICDRHKYRRLHSDSYKVYLGIPGEPNTGPNILISRPVAAAARAACGSNSITAAVCTASLRRPPTPGRGWAWAGNRSSGRIDSFSNDFGFLSRFFFHVFCAFSHMNECRMAVLDGMLPHTACKLR